MARREWPLQFPCARVGCTERANYRYLTRRDLLESFELKNYSNGRWRCFRHNAPDEVLSADNPETRHEIIVEEKPHGKFFGHFGIVSGPGFKAFAKDFPPGTKVIVSAVLLLPTASEANHLMMIDIVEQG